MAAIRIAAKAFADIRFDSLAAAAGFGSRWDVIGRMIPVWNACAESETDTLPEALLNSLFGADISEKLCAAGLAKKLSSGIRLSGYRDHLTWLKRVRKSAKENGQKGGRPKKVNAPESETEFGFENKSAHNSNSNSNRSGNSENSENSEKSEISESTDQAKRKRATQLPASWEPNTQHHDMAKDLRLDIADQVARFRDHFLGKGGLKADWDATFRNWLRNSKVFGPSKPNAPTTKPRFIPVAS